MHGTTVRKPRWGLDDATSARAAGYALHQALLIIPYYADTNRDFVVTAIRTVEEVLAELRP